MLLLLIPIASYLPLEFTRFLLERERMVLGKRRGSLIKRTAIMRTITDDTATTYHIASQPSDHLTIHNPTVMISTKNDNDFLRTCSLCNQNLCHRRDIYMYRYVFMFLNQPFKYMFINIAYIFIDIV